MPMTLEELTKCPMCGKEMQGECSLCEGLFCIECEPDGCCTETEEVIETNLITLLSS